MSPSKVSFILFGRSIVTVDVGVDADNSLLAARTGINIAESVGVADIFFFSRLFH